MYMYKKGQPFHYALSSLYDPASHCLIQADYAEKFPICNFFQHYLMSDKSLNISHEWFTVRSFSILQVDDLTSHTGSWLACHFSLQILLYAIQCACPHLPPPGAGRRSVPTMTRPHPVFIFYCWRKTGYASVAAAFHHIRVLCCMFIGILYPKFHCLCTIWDPKKLWCCYSY